MKWLRKGLGLANTNGLGLVMCFVWLIVCQFLFLILYSTIILELSNSREAILAKLLMLIIPKLCFGITPLGAHPP